MIENLVAQLKSVDRYGHYEGPFADSLRSDAIVWDLELFKKNAWPVGPQLEVGAGWGRYTKALLLISEEVWAIENSPMFVKDLEQLDQGNAGKIRVMADDFYAAPLPHKYFAGIHIADLTINSLAAQLQLGECLSRCSEAMGDGGQIAIYVIKDDRGRRAFRQYQGQIYLEPFTTREGVQKVKMLSLTYRSEENCLDQEALLDFNGGFAYSRCTQHIWISDEIVDVALTVGLAKIAQHEATLPYGGLEGVEVCLLLLGHKHSLKNK